MIITTEPMHYPDTDLQEASRQHNHANAAIRTIGTTLNVIPGLCAEIRRLRSRLTSALADLHNLIAAAKATLSAHADGEQDPLYYLRDELEAQGHLRRDHREERPR